MRLSAETEILDPTDESFFSRVLRDFVVVPSQSRCLLITHLLPDRPTFIHAIQSVFASVRVVAIPYSLDQETLTRLRRYRSVDTPSLEELESHSWTSDLLGSECQLGQTVVVEIGGYLAHCASMPDSETLDNFLGAVEDTAGGHRRYAEKPLAVPVLSAANSPLKIAEDALVGTSILFSTERMLRSKGMILNGIHLAVLGFGKIGESTAREARQRGAYVTVHDPDPIAAMRAIAAGFHVAERRDALSRARVIVGTTGYSSVELDDLDYVRDETFLVSGSSRWVEYELIRHLAGASTGRLRPIQIPMGRAWLVDAGLPINFHDAAEVGPTLRGVQAELVVAASRVATGAVAPGLGEMTLTDRRRIAHIWLDVYGQTARGTG